MCIYRGRQHSRLLTEDLHFRLQAKASDGTVFWTQNADPLSPPPADWPAGQSYRLTHPLQPEALPVGVESAVLELCATKGETELACGIIGQPKIADQPPVFELAAPPQHLSGADWDGRLTLAGYDLTQDDERIVLSLTWLVQAAPDRPLKRFVHAAGTEGQIVAQADAIPANGAIPMPYWRAGRIRGRSGRAARWRSGRCDNLVRGVVSARKRGPVTGSPSQRRNAGRPSGLPSGGLNRLPILTAIKVKTYTATTRSAGTPR